MGLLRKKCLCASKGFFALQRAIKARLISGGFERCGQAVELIRASFNALYLKLCLLKMLGVFEGVTYYSHIGSDYLSSIFGLLYPVDLEPVTPELVKNELAAFLPLGHPFIQEGFR